MEEVRDRIIRIIHEVCHPEKPKLADPAGPLVGPELDSLDFASVLMAVEDEFGVTIDEESVDQVGTLDGLVRFVASKAKP
jgi:acyl carrier protein